MSDEIDISTLQAASGRFLASRDLLAWEADSMVRCMDLVRAFQRKDLDPVGFNAALASERTAAPVAIPKGDGTAVALIELTGVLTPNPSVFHLLGFGTAVRTFMQQLQAAGEAARIKAIVVVVDSPGGSVRLIPEAAQLVRTVRARKPVIVAIDGSACSAAYWIACQSTALIATPSAQVGAIGVLAERPSIARRLQQDGVDVTVVHAGKFKHHGHVALPLEDSERQWLQREVDATYAEFVAAVAAGRRVSPSTVRDGYGEGRPVRAADALALGMIDAVQLVEDAIGRAVAAPVEVAAQLAERIASHAGRMHRAFVAHQRAEIAAFRQVAADRRNART